MHASVIVFPGSNCDRDVAVALEQAIGKAPAMVWHANTEVPATDLIVLPGGFSYGDYLRCGSMAANSPIMRDVIKKAKDGTPVLGICNGFQMLTETGLLPGVLMRNRDLNFICKDVHLKVENPDTPFTRCYQKDQVIRIPIAHHDGNYFTDDETLAELEGDGRIAFRYSDTDGNVSDATNPNGARNNIAGIISARRHILGLMPHPERLADPALGGTDGAPMFKGLVEALH